MLSEGWSNKWIQLGNVFVIFKFLISSNNLKPLFLNCFSLFIGALAIEVSLNEKSLIFPLKSPFESQSDIELFRRFQMIPL